MALLQQQAFDQIDALVKGTDISGGYLNLEYSGGKWYQWVSAGGDGSQKKKVPLHLKATKWLKDLSPEELAWLAAGAAAGNQVNNASLLALAQVRAALQAGIVTVEEAEAYLTTLDPANAFQGDLTKYAKSTAGLEISGQQASMPTEDPDKLSPIEEATEVQKAEGVGPIAAANDATVPFALSVGDVPDVYEADQVQGVIEDLAEQVQSLVAAPKPLAAPNSIPGWALMAGSVPASKLDPLTTKDQLLQYPGPEESIEINIAPSQSMDRWSGSGPGAGPGRVWQVQSYTLPTGWTPTSGITRYRIVKAGMQFGVMSVGTDDYTGAFSGSSFGTLTQMPAMSVCFGIVIRGLPWFGTQAPRGIVLADYSGDPPASLTINGTNKAVFEERTTASFETTPPTGFEAIGSDSGKFIGTGAQFPHGTGTPYRNKISGFGFHLITGQETEDVFAQLNGRPDANFKHLGLAPAGPSVAIPNHLTSELEPLAPICQIETNSSLDIVTAQDTSTGSNQVLVGAPFKWEDCEKMKATASSFCVGVQILPFNRFPQAFCNGSAWKHNGNSPFSDWPLTGLKIVESGHRDWGLDILVV